MSIVRSSLAAVMVVVCACGRSEAPKVPLGSAATPAAPMNQGSSPGLTGQARVVLDSANLSFRAKAYDIALAQYRRSAELAPNEVAPLLGILMVADVTKNSALTNETLPRLRRLDPTMADSSLVTPHSKIIREHPVVRPGTT
jgi:hypothetical protein